ncbi:MAG: hypothetical protein M3Z14_05820 [Candidatus Eremiobacteraeota bacterium]|nr:hypothetical protein [Candidatus Eremiobacteraeota bacterium]
MKRLLLLTLSALTLCLMTPVLADEAPAFDPHNLIYEDPAMHFGAPKGYERLEVPTSQDATKLYPVAVFAKDAGKPEQRTILISVEPYEGTIDGFESNSENELRSQTDGVFVDHKTRTALANGMPVWWQKISFGEGLGSTYRRYAYAAFDGQRGIIVSVTGRLGELSEDEAKNSLSDLSIVVYPRGR